MTKIKLTKSALGQYEELTVDKARTMAQEWLA